MADTIRLGRWAIRWLVLFLLCLSAPLVAFRRSAVMLRETTEQLEISYDPTLSIALLTPALSMEVYQSLSSTQGRSLLATTTTEDAASVVRTTEPLTLNPSNAANPTAVEQASAVPVIANRISAVRELPLVSNVVKTHRKKSMVMGKTRLRRKAKPRKALTKEQLAVWNASLNIQPDSDINGTSAKAMLTKRTPKSPKAIHSFRVPGNATVREQRIIFLMHIHKNAGSTMCKAATLNHVPANGKLNCNVQADQRCCGNNDTLAAQQHYAHTTNYSFVAAERDMYEALDTEHYRYIIVLRNSHDRYLSHYKHVVRSVKYNYTFSHWLAGQSDNFGFRKVCGTKCATIPKYHITEHLFRYTLDRLAQFEDFIFQDDFKNSYIRFAQRVGWKLAPASMHNKSPRVKRNVYPGLTGWDSHMDALENAMYEFAQQRNEGVLQPVFSDLVQQELQSYFAQGPLRNCTLPCCAEQCSTYR